MRRPIARRSTRDRVANALAMSLDLRTANSRGMAYILCITPRTMRRQLAASGTTWRKLLDEERLSRAAAAAERGITSPRALAELVGYCDRNSFFEGFKRWNGRTFSGRTRNHAA